MKRSLSFVAILVAASVMTIGCGFSKSTTNVLGPTPTPTPATANPGTVTGSGTTSAGTSSLVGNWTSPTSTVPSPTSCTNFQFSIATQTATTILGTFSATCGSAGMTLSGNVSGVLDNSGNVAVTATGIANVPGNSNCPFTLNGTGALIDGGYTLTIPFTGTTCQGPVSGTQVLHKAQPAHVVFEAPTPVSPTPNAFVSTLRPKFIVTDAPRTGPVGDVSYQIEVATDEPFSNVYATWTVAEQPGQTAFDMPKDLAYSRVYFWHVRASDPTTPGPWSRTLAIQVTDPPPPPPPVNSGGQDAIDLHSASVSGGSPTDVANWPITTQLSVLDFNGSGVAVQFSKENGPGRWPDCVPPGWDGGIEYTLWMVVNVGGHWYTSGGVEYWNGLGRSGGPPSRFQSNWYYTAAVWGLLATHQPAPGEMVGFFVTAGDARAKDVRLVTERSNVVLVPFPSDSGAYYPF